MIDFVVVFVNGVQRRALGKKMNKKQTKNISGPFRSDRSVSFSAQSFNLIIYSICFVVFVVAALRTSKHVCVCFCFDIAFAAVCQPAQSKSATLSRAIFLFFLRSYSPLSFSTPVAATRLNLISSQLNRQKKKHNHSGFPFRLYVSF